ncbi:GSK3-beta interaction protein [Frankliniella occidentalis]|uniref:GSK3-beta interaction protein n=1 Tax=Frankliniella occidentalis TaxID=133901 RepID=A0A9C6X0B0_FRAOC|nr:GSK3-beta interaction protein [Frankliniella occidentalis]XP_052124608.1 GSK3-beta interaction protein [Frankliniella occidentalis]XP_052124609.1 GSK3-beta interaction protein [Frankliniella occidentalis]
MEEERILEKEQWKAEVSAVIHDIKNHVLQASISSLDATDDCIYFNITTLEGTDFCIQMSKSGFVIAGNHHNISNIQSDEFFETPYSLLDKISPKYRESFAQQLIDSLTALTK